MMQGIQFYVECCRQVDWPMETATVVAVGAAVGAQRHPVWQERWCMMWIIGTPSMEPSMLGRFMAR